MPMEQCSFIGLTIAGNIFQSHGSGGMKDTPGRRGDEGLIQEDFYTVFILRQGQRFRIRAGEGKTEHLEPFGTNHSLCSIPGSPSHQLKII